jgi:hypothetical protein
MKKTLLPENLNNFVAMLQNFWGEYSFKNTEFTIGVDKNTLNDTIILQITRIIEENTNISAENLSIIEVK